MINSKRIALHIEKAKNGSQVSFSYLLDVYWLDVYRFQLQRTKNVFEAEEISIQSFAKAFSCLELYNTKYSFKSWLLVISKNLHIDNVRSQKNKWNTASEYAQKQLQSTLLDQGPTPEDLLITKQDIALLKMQIKLLKPDYQQVLELRFFKHMSYNEIAEITQQPLNTIKVKLLRAKKLLLKGFEK